jgi:putative adenylate-forming enzyme
MSSGTSGNRGLFVASQAERFLWCGNILAKVLPKAPWRRQKIALFLRANSTLYESIQSQRLSFAYFDLLEDPLVLREKLKTFDPDVLVAPPSMLLLLIGSCKPQKVVSIAEVLFASDEKRLEIGFGQKISQIYQCTEGFLGFTCQEGTFHINEDLVILEKEYLDESRFIPIITDLFRKTQPILRYRLDDVLIEKKTPCPCGCAFQAIERIEGRCDDLLQVALPKGGTKPLFPDFVARKIIAASEEIEEYEVVQTKLNRWEIFVKPAYQGLVKKALQELFFQVGSLTPELIFVGNPFIKLPGSKLRRIRRDYATL